MLKTVRIDAIIGRVVTAKNDGAMGREGQIKLTTKHCTAYIDGQAFRLPGANWTFTPLPEDCHLIGQRLFTGIMKY